MSTSERKSIPQQFALVTRLTKKAYVLALLPLLVSAFLMFESISFFRCFSPMDPSRWLFVTPGLAVCIGLLVVAFKIQRQFLGVKITVSQGQITYLSKTDKEPFVASWKSLLYTPPRNQGAVLQALVLADRFRAVTLYDIFTPGFELLCKEVARRKTNSISADSLGNVVLDSRKLH